MKNAAFAVSSLALRLLLSLSFVAWARDARAIGLADVEVAGSAGYGTNVSHGPSPLAVGLGARAGVDVYGVYGGLSVMHYFGTSGDCGGGAPTSGDGLMGLPATFCNAGTGEVSLSQYADLYGVDLGYTFKRSVFKIRPVVGVGDTEITRTGSVGTESITAPPLAQYRSANTLYVQPGVTVLLAVGSFLAGANANLLVIPNVVDISGVTPNMDGTSSVTTTKATFVAFTVHAQVGFRF
jgi:hypothetical protein